MPVALQLTASARGGYRHHCALPAAQADAYGLAADRGVTPDWSGDGIVCGLGTAGATALGRAAHYRGCRTSRRARPASRGKPGSAAGQSRLRRG